MDMDSPDSTSKSADFKGASSSAALYIYSNDLTQEEIQAIISSKGETIRYPNADYQWKWNGRRNDYEDPAQSVRDFLANDFSRIRDGVMKILKDHHGKAELHLIVGIARVLKTEEWPDIHIDLATTRQLSESGLELIIFFE